MAVLEQRGGVSTGRQRGWRWPGWPAVSRPEAGRDCGRPVGGPAGPPGGLDGPAPGHLWRLL